ncbi:hypothetical protein OH77DRAFT_1442986, partial [Trametes cingulata]
MMMDTSERERELQAHIHSLLSLYARKHLATDHVTWTAESVTRCFFEYLHPIPSTDPTAVALPVDPFEILSRRWELSSLDPYEEKWGVDGVSEALRYLKEQIGLLPRQSDAAEKYWRDDTDG